MTLKSIARVAYCIVSEMRKERSVSEKLIIVGRIVYWGILHAVALMVSKRLLISSRT